MLHTRINFLSQENDLFLTTFGQKTITCNVHFGVPGGQGDCAQMGICRVIVDQAPTKEEVRRCRVTKAQLFLDGDGHWSMFFEKADILPCTERAVFFNKWFPVPVAYRLDDAIAEKLDPEAQTLIAAGKYPISRSEDGYLIRF
jgi:hypothetical protein